MNQTGDYFRWKLVYLFFCQNPVFIKFAKQKIIYIELSIKVLFINQKKKNENCEKKIFFFFGFSKIFKIKKSVVEKWENC